jgi:hypothetical protein
MARKAKPTPTDVDADPDRPKPRDRTRVVPKERRTSRLTPRRWLPFLALVALVAGAVVLSRRATEPAAATRPVTSPGALVPVAAPSDALSTAFYCPGGTASGADGAAELSVLVANSRKAATTAEVTFVGSDGTTESLSVPIPGWARTRVTAHDHLTAPWVSATVEVLGGDVSVDQDVSGPLGFDSAPCPTSASPEWFVPSGATTIGAAENLLIYNPFSAPAIVSVAFTSENGASKPRSLQGITIAPGSVTVLGNSDDLPKRRDGIAARVTSRIGQVVVGRVQRYTGEGAEVPGVRDAGVLDAPKGLAATAGIPVTATRWVFPYATNDASVRNAVAIYNPGEETAEVNLWLQYQNRSRNGEIEPVAVTVRGGEQTVVDLRSRPGLEDGVAYSIVLDSYAADGASAVPVVAELEMLNAAVPRPAGAATADDGTQPGETAPDDDESDAAPDAGGAEDTTVTGYAVVPGSPVAATTWTVADVVRTADTRTEVMVMNPGAAEVTVTVEVVGAGDRKPLGSATKIAAGDQQLLDLSSAGAYGTLVITAQGGPVAVERVVVGIGRRGLAAMIATPVPGTVRTLPAVFQP